MVIDSDHIFKLTVNGNDMSSYVDPWSLDFKDAEGGEVDTLSFTMREGGPTIREWNEIILYMDPNTGNEKKLFGGFVIKFGAPYVGVNLSYTVRAQGYVALLSRIETPHKSYFGWLPGAIVNDLFNLSGLTEFDSTTYVTQGTLLKGFVVDREEKLTSVLDRLADVSGNWSWRLDADKFFHFGPSADDPADFGISDAENANYGSGSPAYYPVSAGSVDIGVDGGSVVNRVQVNGGSRPSDETTENFTGNGVATTFSLAHRDLYDVIVVTVDGVIFPDGTDWWHTFPERSTLVDYRAGTFRFLNAPVNGALIVIRYSYWVPVSVVSENLASITYYNRTFFKLITNSQITSEDAATELATTYLAEYSYGQIEGSADVLRAGLRAGQSMPCKFDAMGIDSEFVIRSIAFRIDKSRKHLVSTVRFGARSRTFGRMMQLLSSGNSAAYQQMAVQIGQLTISPEQLGLANISEDEPALTFPGMVWLDPNP